MVWFIILFTSAVSLPCFEFENYDRPHEEAEAILNILVSRLLLHGDKVESWELRMLKIFLIFQHSEWLKGTLYRSIRLHTSYFSTQKLQKSSFLPSSTTHVKTKNHTNFCCNPTSCFFIFLYFMKLKVFMRISRKWERIWWTDSGLSCMIDACALTIILIHNNWWQRLPWKQRLGFKNHNKSQWQYWILVTSFEDILLLWMNLLQKMQNVHE